MANKSKETVEIVEKKYAKITKLLCDFGVYLRERKRCNLPIQEKCQKCGTAFKENDELYKGTLENGEIEIICKKCSKE